MEFILLYISLDISARPRKVLAALSLLPRFLAAVTSRDSILTQMAHYPVRCGPTFK